MMRATWGGGVNLLPSRRAAAPRYERRSAYEQFTDKRGVSMKIALGLHKIGLTSDLLHSLGFASIFAALALWGRSAAIGNEKKQARSERVAIFVGLWPPTFFLLGKVLQDLEATPVQQVLRARGAGPEDVDQALRSEAAGLS
jgi:hypothetical protein